MTRRWILLLSIIFLLTACGPADTPADPTATPTSTATSTPTPTDTPTPTPTPTETPIPCFTLLEPADGTEFESPLGLITFAWTEQFGAESYRLLITLPNGNVEPPIETTETSLERWLESYPLGGEYSWVVKAVDGEGGVICIAGLNRFKKPTNEDPNSSGNSGEDGNNNGGWLCPDGSEPHPIYGCDGSL